MVDFQGSLFFWREVEYSDACIDWWAVVDGKVAQLVMWWAFFRGVGWIKAGDWEEVRKLVVKIDLGWFWVINVEG